MLRSCWLNTMVAVGVMTSLVALGGCGQFSPPYLKPLSAKTRALLAEKGMSEQSPILVRIFKAESGARSVEGEGRRPLLSLQDLSDL